MLVFKWVPSLSSDSGISKKNTFSRQAAALAPTCLNVNNGLLSSYSCSVKSITEPSSCSVTSEENSSNTFGSVEPNDLISENNTMKMESTTSLDVAPQEKVNSTDSQETTNTDLLILKPDPSDDTDRSSEVTMESTSEVRSLDPAAASPSEQSTA
ncbi:unnamed protein product [Dicrocoelium dendriticum]|nr:unnamed protein product [Dicrocoelium dendriticum]